MAAQVAQQSSGRLFSGGDLLVHSNGFDQRGQVVALGNATLEIANGFTGRDVLAGATHRQQQWCNRQPGYDAGRSANAECRR